MDRFNDQLALLIADLADAKGEGQKLTMAQIHEIGVQAVEKALGPQPDELRPWAVAGMPDNERQLENVG